MAAIAMLLVVIATSLSVGHDARDREWSQDGFIRSPAGWLIGCLLFWIGVFPLYLLTRHKTPRKPATGADTSSVALSEQPVAGLDGGVSAGQPTGPDHEARRFQLVKGTRPWAWVLVALLGLVPLTFLAARDLGLWRSQHTAATIADQPAPAQPLSDQITRIRGPRNLAYGSLFVVSGRGTPHAGNIFLEERWNNRPWKLLTSTTAHSEPFHFVVNVDHHGLLSLRITRPDGLIALGTFRVVARTTHSNPTPRASI